MRQNILLQDWRRNLEVAAARRKESPEEAWKVEWGGREGGREREEQRLLETKVERSIENNLLRARKNWGEIPS